MAANPTACFIFILIVAVVYVIRLFIYAYVARRFPNSRHIQALTFAAGFSVLIFAFICASQVSALFSGIPENAASATNILSFGGGIALLNFIIAYPIAYFGAGMLTRTKQFVEQYAEKHKGSKPIADDLDDDDFHIF